MRERWKDAWGEVDWAWVLFEYEGWREMERERQICRHPADQERGKGLEAT